MDDPATAALPCGNSTRFGGVLSGIEPALTALARHLLRDGVSGDTGTCVTTCANLWALP